MKTGHTRVPDRMWVPVKDRGYERGGFTRYWYDEPVPGTIPVEPVRTAGPGGRTVTLRGFSDDRFVIDGSIEGEPDEIECYRARAKLRIADETGAGLFVTGETAFDGGWAIAVAPLGTGSELPPWPARWLTVDGRTGVRIEIPKGARIEARP